MPDGTGSLRHPQSRRPHRCEHKSKGCSSSKAPSWADGQADWRPREVDLAAAKLSIPQPGKERCTAPYGRAEARSIARPISIRRLAIGTRSRLAAPEKPGRKAYAEGRSWRTPMKLEA